MKNKEIEELLNKLKQHLEYQREVSDIDSDVAYLKLTIKEYKLLLSYIEQLEECYCNRTDCIGRIKDSKKYDSLLQKYKQLENNRDKAIEILNKWEKENINPVFRKGLLKILNGDSE